jgi:hypothetical protein
MRISINILVGRQTSMTDSEFGNDLHHSAWGTDIHPRLSWRRNE